MARLQADLVLLPYDREVYRSRGSGEDPRRDAKHSRHRPWKGCAFAQPAR